MPRQPRNPRSTPGPHGNDIDRADDADPVRSDSGSFDEVPREFSHRSQPYARDARGVPEAFGFSPPSSNYPYAGIASAARRGRFFGRGPKGYRRSDDRIREDVSDRLMTHPDIDASGLEVEVANGVVSLTGDVADRHEKRLAEYIAEDAVGVNDVDNRLKVRHGFWTSMTGEQATEHDLSRRKRNA